MGDIESGRRQNMQCEGCPVISTLILRGVLFREGRVSRNPRLLTLKLFMTGSNPVLHSIFHACRGLVDSGSPDDLGWTSVVGGSVPTASGASVPALPAVPLAALRCVAGQRW